MILVLAAPRDASAAALASRWRTRGARLLTPVDLSRSGWCWDPADPLAGYFAVGSDVVPAVSIGHVVTLVSAIQSSDLDHIAPADRDYVAAETTAFLVAWLTSLGGRVLNPPTPLCLSGPHLRDAQWRRDAALAGLPVTVTRRAVSCRDGDIVESTDATRSPTGPVQVSVVAGSLVAPDAVPPAIGQGLERLAAKTGAGLLSARFLAGVDGQPCRFDGARAGVDLTAPGVIPALERSVQVAS